MARFTPALKKFVGRFDNQTDAAKAIGCGQQTISDMLSGRRRPSATMAIKLSKATGIPKAVIRPDIFEGQQ